jgi:phosphoglycerol transferase MdoB-like AlkP superfamily enzyme
MRSWNRFFIQFQKDVKLWIFCVAYLMLYRLIFIASYHQKINPSSGFFDFASVLSYGFCFDIMVAGYFILIPFLLSVANGFTDLGRITEKARAVFGFLFMASATILGIVNHGFFGEFDDQLNAFLFQVYFDDTRAVFATLWQEYHLLGAIIFSSVLITLGVLIIRKMTRKEFVSEKTFAPLISSLPRKIAVSLIILISLVISLRGSAGSKPAKLRYVDKTNDQFLNKSIMNPFHALRYAILDYTTMTSSLNGIDAFLPDRDIVKAAKDVSGMNENMQNLDDYFLKSAQGPAGTPPRHIFLIIGESYDTWPGLDQFKSLHLVDNRKEFAREGISVENFLPGSSATMSSLGVILTGLPDSGILINYHIASRKPYPTSMGEIFRKLGYRTRFFYGGYPTWQRIMDFTASQGFDEVYDATFISPSTSKNAWGVDDAALFQLAAEKTVDDRPSLNVILTTNDHPPYHIDVKAKGFTLEKVPDDIAPFWKDTLTLKMAGHIWYTDHCIGNFVRSMEKKVSLPLFALTGDHYSRRYINANPDFFEKSAVPFVLYGKETLKGIALPPGAAGSHLDITPTLAELTAPKGFQYHSLGENILSPESRHVGVGREKVITGDCIVGIGNRVTAYPLPDRPLPSPLPDLIKMKKLHDELHGIAWWRVQHGNRF